MKTVLVIDGVKHDLEALQKLLRDNGYAASEMSESAWRVEETLQRSEKRFRSFFENAPIGMFRSSLDGKLLGANPAVSRMLGYCSPEELLEAVNRTGVAGALYPEPGHREELFEKVLSGPGWVVSEERFRCKDGSIIDCHFHLRAVHGADGKPFELEGFVEDITERKQSELALRLTQFAIDHTIDQAFWITPDGRFLYVNEAACAALGYSCEELVGMSVPDIDPLYPREHWPRHWQELKKNGAARFESCHRAKDGRVYPVEVRANFVAFDGKEYNCAFVTDISERKRAEEELRRTNDMLRAIIEAAPTAIIGLDLDGNVRNVWNPAAEKMLGWSAHEVMGRPLPNVPVESREEFRSFREWIGSGKTMDGVEVRRRRKDGTPIDYSIYSSPLRDADGGIIGNISVLVDITERKRFEEALRESEARFRMIVETADEGIWQVDREWKTTYVNQRMEQMLGCEPGGMLGRHICNFMDDEGRQAVAELMSRREQGVRETHDFRFVRCDGSTLDALVSASPLVDDRGEFVGSFAMVTDITERKRTEDALKLSQYMVDRASLGIMRGSDDAWILSVNEYWARNLGYTPEELCSMTFFDIDPNLTPESWRAHRQKLTATGSNTFETEHRRKDGTVFPVEVTVNYLKYRDQAFSCSFAKDITERKRTERVMTARMRLLQFAATHTLDELLEATLNEAEALTESLIGFYHFFEADQKTLLLQNWSTRTKNEFCKAEGKGLHYEVSAAGVWVDCIHQRRPVIHDDYASLPHRKGLPPGHAPVVRELVVPVFRGDNIVAVLGVGNKPQAYTPQDVETVSLLADLAWTIAERKQAEEALRDSERKYRSIVEHAPFGIARSTKDGKLVSVNPALAAILKYDSAEELLETINRSSIQDVLFPEPSERAPLVENILSGDSWHVFNNRLRCKDGSIVTCRVHSRRIVDEADRTSEFESFQENITDQVEAEQALRESEEKFRVLAETSPAAICIHQGEKLIYANPAMERLLGYSADELYRMKFWEWAHEDFKELIRTRGLAGMAGESVPGQYEARYVTKAGNERCVLISAGVMEYQGRFTGVASFLDITERKRTEELIRASLKEKEVLLKEIHHRVKNNLQVVSSLLFLQAQKIRDPELAAHFTESQNRIHSMALAHEQLYQSKNLADVRLPEYVESLVEEILQVFRSGEKTVCCRIDVDDIDLDIEQVVPCGLLITELLSNALRHAFPGPRTGTVSVEMHRRNDLLSLTVRDNGVGLPADLDVATAGTLGLQLVRALTDQLDGTLELVRQAGAEFRVTFPVRNRQGLVDP